MAKSNEPLIWSLFSAGGVVAALLVPVHILLLGIAVPLGWVDLDHSRLLELVQNPLTKLYLFVLIGLPLFHWSPRFRFTLIDLGLKKFALPISVVCYISAVVGTVFTAFVLWRV